MLTEAERQFKKTVEARRESASGSFAPILKTEVLLGMGYSSEKAQNIRRLAHKLRDESSLLFKDPAKNFSLSVEYQSRVEAVAEHASLEVDPFSNTLILSGCYGGEHQNTFRFIVPTTEDGVDDLPEVFARVAHHLSGSKKGRQVTVIRESGKVYARLHKDKEVPHETYIFSPIIDSEGQTLGYRQSLDVKEGTLNTIWRDLPKEDKSTVTVSNPG